MRNQMTSMTDADWQAAAERWATQQEAKRDRLTECPEKGCIGARGSNKN